MSTIRKEIPHYGLSLRSRPSFVMTIDYFSGEKGLEGAQRLPAPSPSNKKHPVIPKPHASHVINQNHKSLQREVEESPG